MPKESSFVSTIGTKFLLIRNLVPTAEMYTGPHENNVVDQFSGQGGLSLLKKNHYAAVTAASIGPQNPRINRSKSDSL
jgi:hypothetical protein